MTMLEWGKSWILVFISTQTHIARFSIVCIQLALRKGMANLLYLIFAFLTSYSISLVFLNFLEPQEATISQKIFLEL